MPTTMDRATEARPISKEVRVPYNRAEYRSRPWLSVPNQYWGEPFSDQAGASKASIRSMEVRSKGS